MNKNQSNKLRMLIGVSAYLAENPEIVNEVPEMTVAKENLDGIVSDINYNYNVSNTALFGKTDDKHSARSEVVKNVMAFAGGLYAWAAKTGNNEIINASSVVRSDLYKIREAEFAPVIKDLLDKAKDRTQELADFGITEELISNLENYLNNYSSALGKREISAGIRSNAVRSLKELFAESIKALDVLDKFAEVQKLKHKAFYEEYLVLRRIKNLGENKSKVPPEIPDNNITLPIAS